MPIVHHKIPNLRDITVAIIYGKNLDMIYKLFIK